MSITADFTPARNTITAISQGFPSTVTTGSAHGYSVGAIVRLNVPKAYGMPQADGAQVQILTVPSPTSFTTDLDTSSFQAFSAPVSPKQAAQVVPMGEFGDFLASTKRNVLGGQPDGSIPTLS